MKEIKTTTTYTKETVKQFLEIYFFERVKKLRIILNIFIIVMIVSFFINDTKSTLDIIAFVFSLFGLLELNTSMLPKLNYYRLIKKKNSVINSEVSYVFKKDNFKLNKNEYIDYNTLKKIIETEKYYYLYVNDSRALIVDKASLNKEETDQLTNLFKEKVSTYKYKNNV